MQHRMKEFSMTQEQMEALLERAMVGRVSTNGRDGYPYTVAVHFVYLDGRIYFHGLLKGQKLENLVKDSRICFEVDEMAGILRDKLDTACKADTAYESVVAAGEAFLVEEIPKKGRVLRALTRKYIPDSDDLPMPETRIRNTAVVELIPARMTGKYHRA